MKSRMILAALLLATITTIGTSQGKQSQDAKDRSKDRLRISELPWDARGFVGLKGVRVLTYKIPDKLKSAGLTREKLITTVELRLRSAGIRVNSVEEHAVSPDKPTIWVQATTAYGDINNANRNPATTIVYNISARLEQDVTLARSPFARVSGSTWQHGWTATSPRNEFPERAIETLNMHMDIFVKAYFKANPKKKLYN